MQKIPDKETQLGKVQRNTEEVSATGKAKNLCEYRKMRNAFMLNAGIKSYVREICMRSSVRGGDRSKTEMYSVYRDCSRVGRSDPLGLGNCEGHF